MLTPVMHGSRKFVRGGPTDKVFFIKLMRGESIQIPLKGDHLQSAGKVPFAGGPMVA